ncbi:superoxide dismutase family protein [soil metagenome]
MRPCLLLALGTLLLAACASTPPERAAARTLSPLPPPATIGTAQRAVANLAAASGTLVSGRVELRAVPGGVHASGTIGGLRRNGTHLLQVHARGDCSAVDASSAGPAFEAAGRNEASGGRIVADTRGVARVDLLLPGVVLGGGAGNDIDRRALLVLDAAAGAGGARMACGVIAAQR